MPRNTREWAKRKIGQAKNNMDWVGKHLTEVIEVYKSNHPEITEPLDNIVELLVIMDMSLDEIDDMI